jgi:hypothetical protein
VTRTTRAVAAPSSPRAKSVDEVAALRRLIEDQQARIDDLLVDHGALRAQLARQQLELLRRIDELHDVLRAVPRSPASPPAFGVPGAPPLPASAGESAKAADYARMVIRLRALVRSVVPLDAHVSVVSRGDDELLDLGGRRTRHFPEHDDGRWAGFHPRDSAAAIEHLQRQQAEGVDHLLIPASSRWWLDHYLELRQWLDAHARLVVRRDDTCVIFALQPGSLA